MTVPIATIQGLPDRIVQTALVLGMVSMQKRLWTRSEKRNWLSHVSLATPSALSPRLLVHHFGRHVLVIWDGLGQGGWSAQIYQIGGSMHRFSYPITAIPQFLGEKFQTGSSAEATGSVPHCLVPATRKLHEAFTDYLIVVRC